MQNNYSHINGIDVETRRILNDGLGTNLELYKQIVAYVPSNWNIEDIKNKTFSDLTVREKRYLKIVENDLEILNLFKKYYGGKAKPQEQNYLARHIKTYPIEYYIKIKSSNKEQDLITETKKILKVNDDETIKNWILTVEADLDCHPIIKSYIMELIRKHELSEALKKIGKSAKAYIDKIEIESKSTSNYSKILAKK